MLIKGQYKNMNQTNINQEIIKKSNVSILLLAIMEMRGTKNRDISW